MKKHILLRLLVVGMVALSCRLTHTAEKNPFDATMKPFPGREGGYLNFFKMVAEIPTLKQGIPEDKKKWDNLAKKSNELLTIRVKEEERVKKHPIMQELEKLEKTVSEKSKKLNEGIENIVKDNPQIKKLQPEKKALEEKLKLLGEQRKSLGKKISGLYAKIWKIKKEISKIEEEATKSKDFPQVLKKLDTELNQLEVKIGELNRKRRKLEREVDKKADIREWRDLREELSKLFKKMTKKQEGVKAKKK